MKKYISIILILFFLLCTKYVCSQEFDSPKDSLLHILEMLPQNDTLRLSALKEFARIEQNTENGLKLAAQLINESSRLNVDYYKAFGYYYSLIYYYNRQDFKQVDHISSLLLPLAENEKIWIIYFDALKVNNYCNILQENFELAIHDALNMLDKAKEVGYENGMIQANICLGVAYIGSTRYEKGVDALKEACRLMDNTVHPINFLDANTMLISSSMMLERYNDMYSYIVHMEKEFKKLVEIFPFYGSAYFYYATIEIYYSYYYLKTNQPDRAYPHLLKAKENLNKNGFTMHKNIYHVAMSHYFKEKKDFKQSIVHLDSAIVLIKDILPTDYYGLIGEKANILMGTGNTEQALPLYKEAIYGKDSLRQCTSKKQLVQFQEIYNLNQLQIEKEKIKSNRQRLILLLIIVITIISLLLVLRAIFVRRKLKEAEKQMRNASILANEANQIKDRFLTNLSYSLRTPLNSVVGFSQLIADEPEMDKEQRREFGEIVQKNSAVLMNLVNNVLDLSRLEAGMMKFDITTYSVDELLINIEYIIKSQYSDKVKLTIDNKATETTLKIDGKRFIQMFVSMATVPLSFYSNRQISIVIEEISADRLKFIISGSPLGILFDSSQETIIQNDINRLFIEYFGGTYTINPKNSNPGTIIVELRIDNSLQ